MALFKIKDKAIRLRKKGYSYSQIKSAIGVSKGTLSEWLRPYPLSTERINELRANSPQRIERYRNTMAKKRQVKLDLAFEKAKKDIGTLSERELFIFGFALYWAEGGKTRMGSMALGNTDPSMLKFFMKWLNLLGVPKSKLRIKLHLYKDMDKEKAISYWKKTLGVSTSNFIKPYIKDSRLVDLTYKNGFGHGTCNIVYDNTEMARYVLMGLKYVVEHLTSQNIRP